MLYWHIQYCKYKLNNTSDTKICYINFKGKKFYFSRCTKRDKKKFLLYCSFDSVIFHPVCLKSKTKKTYLAILWSAKTKWDFIKPSGRNELLEQQKKQDSYKVRMFKAVSCNHYYPAHIHLIVMTFWVIFRGVLKKNFPKKHMLGRFLEMKPKDWKGR